MEKRRTSKALALFVVLALVVSILSACSSDSSGSTPTSSSASASGGTSSSTSEPAPSAYGESPMLAARVESGDLPPVEERLPNEPMVVVPTDSVGAYGGELITRLNSVGDWGDIWHSTMPHMLWYDESANTVIGDIAKGYAFNDDKTVLTLYLREGLKWSDGDPFDADDLVCWWTDYTMHEAFNPEMTPPSQWAPGGEAMEVVKVDDWTVEYRFAASYPAALSVITSWQGIEGNFYAPSHLLRAVHADYVDEAEANKLSKELYDKDTWIEAVSTICSLQWPGSDPNCLLPTLGMWVQSEMTTTEIRFTRNPYYWAVDTEGNQLPYIDTIKAEILEDNEVYDLNIMQGKYDFGKVSTDKLELIKSNEESGNYNVRLWNGDIASNPIYSFNQNHRDEATRAVFQDVRFRQAMSLAINRDEINELIYDGYGIPTQATVNTSASFYDPAWSSAFSEYDVDKANALLDEMGLNERDGDGFRKMSNGNTLLVVMQLSQPVHELVRDYWQAVGVRVEINPVDITLYWERGSAGDLDVGMAGLDNSVEMKVFQNVSKFWMECGDLSYAVDWVEWFNTGGIGGELPPEKVQQYFANWQAIQLASGDEYDRLAKDIFKFFAEELYVIGTVGYVPTAVYVSNNLQNVPQSVLFMDATNWWLMSRPDQWYLAG